MTAIGQRARLDGVQHSAIEIAEGLSIVPQYVASSARESLRAWSPRRDVGQSGLTSSFLVSFSGCTLSRSVIGAIASAFAWFVGYAMKITR
jgi:hypothetical protein